MKVLVVSVTVKQISVVVLVMENTVRTLEAA